MLIIIEMWPIDMTSKKKHNFLIIIWTKIVLFIIKNVSFTIEYCSKLIVPGYNTVSNKHINHRNILQLLSNLTNFRF